MFWEKFFGKNFSGGFFGEMLWRIFLVEFFWKDFFVGTFFEDFLGGFLCLHCYLNMKGIDMSVKILSQCKKEGRRIFRSAT